MHYLLRVHVCSVKKRKITIFRPTQAQQELNVLQQPPLWFSRQKDFQCKRYDQNALREEQLSRVLLRRWLWNSPEIKVIQFIGIHGNLPMFLVFFFLFKPGSCHYPVSTRRRFDVHTTSITVKRRRIDVKTTSCAYWAVVNQ